MSSDDGVQKRINSAMFSLDGFTMLIICCARTRTMISLYLMLSAECRVKKFIGAHLSKQRSHQERSVY